MFNMFFANFLTDNFPISVLFKVFRIHS